jgi:hypothetical protein
MGYASYRAWNTALNSFDPTKISYAKVVSSKLSLICGSKTIGVGGSYLVHYPIGVESCLDATFLWP